MDEWLTAMESEVRKDTADMYEVHVGHYLHHFRRLREITHAAMADYMRKRLSKVQASTVRKEMTGLRRFVAWATERGYMREPPMVPDVPRGALGTVHPMGERRRVDLTAEQVEALLAALPERTRKGNPARAYHTVMWETGLREGTLARLSVPEHYQRGAEVLRVTPDIDKSRYGRDLPLTPRARAALDSVAPDAGLVFGRVDYRRTLRSAAETAGVDPDAAAHLSDHDFRHARLTDWGSRTTSLTGLQYLAGHKHAQTTSRYLHAQRREAEAILGTEASHGEGEDSEGDGGEDA